MTKTILTTIICLTMAIYVQAQSNTYDSTNKRKKGGGITGIALGVRASYFVPTDDQKTGVGNFLFLKNAVAIGADVSFIPKKGTTRFKLAAEYITGNNYNEGIAAYAKEKDIAYTSTKFTKAKPSGFRVMAGPQFMLFPKSKRKKLPLMWFDLQAGAMFSNQQTLQFFQGQSTTPSKEVKSKAVSFVYNPSLVVNLLKTKKVFLNLRAGYSNFGGFGIGINIAEQDCSGAPCCRCQGTFCNPCNPTATESINN
jgi:hypothetical protein